MTMEAPRRMQSDMLCHDLNAACAAIANCSMPLTCGSYVTRSDMVWGNAEEAVTPDTCVSLLANW